LATKVDFRPVPSPIQFQLGFATYDTAAEFRDVHVERDGEVIYRADFSDAAKWKSLSGHWEVGRGTYRQKEDVTSWTYLADSSLPATGGDRTVVHVKARKLHGKEGFAITVGKAEGRRVQWNLGGWENYQHAVETGDSIVGTPVIAKIETDRWYDVAIEVAGRRLRCFLDAALVSDVTLPSPEAVLALAGRDVKSGDVIVKILNTTRSLVETRIQLDGADHLVPQGELTVLSSNHAEDENSFDQPTRIVPETRKVNFLSTSKLSLGPYSLNILRFHIKDQTQ
jgi:alpha-L-arabinofuranosidase